VQTPGQIDAAGNIAPLIRATELQPAVIAPVELGKVVGLQDHVGELGKADPRALALDTLLYRLLLHHRIDRKVLADIAQEGEHIEILGPVEVIDHDRGLTPRIKVDKPGHLRTNLVDPASDDIGGIQLPLLGLEARITDQPGCTTDQRNGPVSGQLETPQHQQRHQRADVQTVRRGVKAAV
jgi:hypothetical protein